MDMSISSGILYISGIIRTLMKLTGMTQPKFCTPVTTTSAHSSPRVSGRDQPSPSDLTASLVIVLRRRRQ